MKAAKAQNNNKKRQSTLRAHAGRKNLYPILVRPRIETIRQWCQAGVPEKDICANLGVALATFGEYKNKYPALMDALKKGKEDANAVVIGALMRRATGFEYEEVETTNLVTSQGKVIPGTKRVKKTIKRFAPDTAAAAFWLKNRAGWADRQEITGADGQPIIPGNVQIIIPDNGRGDMTPPPKGNGG